MRQERARVAVIGGGWAGMASAAELAAAGIRVVVFEAAKVLGGRARRVEIDGVRLDNGLHVLLGAYRETLRLIEQVRPANETAGLRRLPLTLRIEPGLRLRAAPLPAPLHMVAALCLANGLSAGEKIRAARFILAHKRCRFRCDPAHTVEALLAAHRQTGKPAQLLWGPLCVAALNTRPAEASAQVFLNVLRDSLGAGRCAADLLLPETDFSSLFPERARAFVERRGGGIRLGVTVKSLGVEDGGFRVNEERGFTHTIVAVHPHRLEALASGVAALSSAVDQVRRYQYRPIYSVYLQYPEPLRLPAPMVGLAGGLAQWVFDRGALCGQAGLIGAVISADGPHEALAHEILAQRVHGELLARWPALPAPRWHRVIAEKRATFACVPGLPRPLNRTAMPRLYLAGDYTDSEHPATLETAVRSGVAAARLVLEDLGMR
ncbi:MAG TPA: hydroxysqualene dehydroxylase HpnE [Burkholderiales bacterium]|jgi:squalene-associated FAD-dependent desaturase|nr:hydroxysqualene dehydroxylase HpnE [Burkholderiales bacterium]